MDKSKNPGKMQRTVAIIIGVILTLIIVVAAMLFYLPKTTPTPNEDPKPAENTPTVIYSAKILSQRAEGYYTIHKDYPKTVADFSKEPESDFKALKLEVGDTEPTAAKPKKVQYVYCKENAAQVTYYDAATGKPAILALGNASSSSPC